MSKNVSTVHHVREFMNRIILIEERIRVSGGVIGETLRECQIRLDQCAAGLANLDTRMRNQEWYHDVSERQSSKDIQQIVEGRSRNRRAMQQHGIAATARAFNGVPLRHDPNLEQLQENIQPQGPDENTIHQRITRFLADYQGREANYRGNLELEVPRVRLRVSGVKSGVKSGNTPETLSEQILNFQVSYGWRRRNPGK